MSVKIFTRDVDQLGERPALVLLPAFPLDHRMWDAVVKRFEAMPIVAVDPPGFGGSKVPHDSPSLEYYADYVATAVRSCGIERAIIVGSSMGGYTALAMLERHRRLVAGLGMIGSHADIDTPQQRAKRTELAIDALMGRAQEQLAEGITNLVSGYTRNERAGIVAMVQQWVREAPDGAIDWASRAMAMRPSRLNVVRSCNCPVLVMRGQEDNATRLEQAEAVARAAGVNLLTVENAGHLLPVEAPAAVARALIRLYAQAIDH